MRNSKLKGVRSEWRDSRFFYGKNRVMQLALGKTAADEYKEGLHQLSQELEGNVGLLFTNKMPAQVKEWFASFSAADFARSGFVVAEDVSLSEGPLTQFSHSMEPQLRQLGLPTALKKGIVTLLNDYSVCRKGDTLSPEQARILKLLDVKMADFKIVLKAAWSQDGQFSHLDDESSEEQQQQQQLAVSTS